jgi:molecular chaperone DnaK
MVQKLVKDHFGKEPHRGVNPDEVVAIGAAIQAAVLGGEAKEILLLDVTPLTLGIKVESGLMAPLITRNSAIPTTKTETFTTAAENQTGVTVEVFQGERPMADDNRKLGNFDLTGIPPAPRGTPKIEVKFDLDANGLLHVSAKDVGTGREQQIKITATTGLSEADIRKMVKEAEDQADKDKERKELAEARNQAEHTIYATEKSLRDFGDKLQGADKEKIERAVADLRKAKDGGNAGEMKRAVEEVQRVLHEFSKTLYEEASRRTSTPQAPPPEAGRPGGEKIIDAEFKTKDDRGAA